MTYNRYIQSICERALSRAQTPDSEIRPNGNSEKSYEGEVGGWIKRAEIIEKQIGYFKTCGKYTQASIAEQKLAVLKKKIDKLSPSDVECESEEIDEDESKEERDLEYEAEEEN